MQLGAGCLVHTGSLLHTEGLPPGAEGAAWRVTEQGSSSARAPETENQAAHAQLRTCSHTEDPRLGPGCPQGSLQGPFGAGVGSELGRRGR